MTTTSCEAYPSKVSFSARLRTGDPGQMLTLANVSYQATSAKLVAMAGST